MSLSPDQPPSPSKPKLSFQERQARHVERVKTIRLRMLIGRELDHRGITAPAAIGEALGLPAVEVAKLLTRHRWRDGDGELLRTAAAQLGLPVPKDTG